MEGHDNNGEDSNQHQRADRRDEIWSKVVRAGKRTYFFDVKATRANDFYLTITESKKKLNRDGGQFYEKHKLFLYKEDFDKFSESLQEVIDKIDVLRTSHENGQEETAAIEPQEQQSKEKKSEEPVSAGSTNSFTEVNFEDLGSAENE